MSPVAFPARKTGNCLIVFAIICLSDIFVCVQYFGHGHVYWGGLTLAFVLLPSVVIQLFSARWYAADGQLTCRSTLVHLLLLQPLERYDSWN